MTLHSAERERWRRQWRLLIKLALELDQGALKSWKTAPTSWPSPLDQKAGSYILFGFARTAAAYGQAAASERHRWEALLKLHAETAGDVLAASDPDLSPGEAAVSRTAPFRRDIDG